MRRTREALQAVATHVVARRRFEVTGKFGLRAAPGGFGTPMFDLEVVRVDGTTLVHEIGGDRASFAALDGATVGELAGIVGVDLTRAFAAGDDTPALTPDSPLAVDAGEAAAIASWFDLGWRAIDAVCAGARSPSVLQLWPEHFDAGCSVAVDVGERCNLGASPGDASSDDEPYLYVGPWGSERPGDASYWNAGFGAVLRRSSCPDVAAGVEFLSRGLARLGGGTA